MNLTGGSIARICAGEEVNQANMQVLGYKNFKSIKYPTERYRILLSDGEFSSSFCMLSTELNPMIHNGELEQFTIIRVNKYMCNQALQPRKKVIILLEVTVIQLGARVGRVIGSPQSMSMAMGGNGGPLVRNQLANSNLGGSQAMGGIGGPLVRNQMANSNLGGSQAMGGNGGTLVQSQIANSNLGGSQAMGGYGGPLVQNQIANSNLGGVQAMGGYGGPMVRNLGAMGGYCSPMVQDQIAHYIFGGPAMEQNQIANSNIGGGTKRPNEQQPQAKLSNKKHMVNDQSGTTVLNPSVEEIRTNVRNQYIEQINQTNSKIQEIENKIRDNVLLTDKKKKELTKKHDLEKESLNKETKILNEEKSLLEISLADIQQKLADRIKVLENIRKSHVEMEEKHKNEKVLLEVQLKKEDDEAPQNLANLKIRANQLAKDLKKLDSDPDNDEAAKESLEVAKESLEAAKGTLECPVCLETMRPPIKIWMCKSSHLACEPCKNNLRRRSCPTCRTGKVTLRAFMAENFARSLFKK